jgi:FtsH-binding integral membrane protein
MHPHQDAFCFNRPEEEKKEIMKALLYIHSWLRWVIVLVGLIALVIHALGLIQKKSYNSMSRGLMSAFTGLLDLQVLVGIIYLIAGWQGFVSPGGGFPRAQVGHTFTMLVAVVAAHIITRNKEKPDHIRYRNGVIAILVVAVLLVLATVFVLQGVHWSFRF